MAGNPITKIIITAKDEASAVFTSLQAKVAAIATAISGYFGAKMFGEALGSAMDFEAAMSRVQAASGASGAEFAALKVAAERAGATTKYTATEAAGALENLAKSGLTATQAVQALPAVLNLAQAGGVELGTAAEFITKAVNGMGLSFSEAGRVADVLALGANASNTSVEGLAQALSFAAPLAHSLGLSLEETVGIIGKFADAGIDASRAGTALNSILAQFSDPASKFRTELANAGIITDNFGEALHQLAAKGPEGQKAINAVGQEAGPALRALLNQGIGALDDLTGKLKNAQGSAAETAKTMGSNLTGAMSGLSTAWDAVRRNLVAPLLEPLTAQVNALAARFRDAVADGTIAKFGELIRAAFENGAKWVQEFAAKIDFEAVIARLQGFAEKTGEAFEKVGQHATAAGGVLQTAYGVMSAGVNTVLAAIYKAGEGMSWVASAFLADLAKISRGIDKVTPDVLTDRFKRAAEELQTQAQAAYAVSEEFGRKSAAAFDDAAAGAETAANGWKTLTKNAEEAAPAVQQAAADVQEAGAQATLTGEQLDALGEGAEFVAGAIQKAGDAASAAAPQIKDMGAEAAASAAQLQAAFDRLGVVSQSALKQAAENAKRDFEIIRDSGQASVRDVQNAFAVYAEKAIAANGGVASSALKTQASMHGMTIEADAGGKAVVRSMTDAANAIGAAGDKADELATKFGIIKSEAEDTADTFARWEAESNAARGERTVGGGDGFKEALRRGMVTPDMEAAFRDAYDAALTKLLGGIQALSSYSYTVQANMAFETALKDAAKAAKAQAAKESRGESPHTTRYEVRIRLGAIDRTIEVASANDAQSLNDLLRQLETAAARAA